MRRYALVVFGALTGVFAALHSTQADTITPADCCYAPGGILAETYVKGPTSPGKWGDSTLGTPATVTWSVADANGYYTDESGAGGGIVPFSNFVTSGDWHAALVQAFNSWSAVAGITFVEVTDSDLAFDAQGATTGDIRLGGHVFDGTGSVLAHGYYPPVNGYTAAGDIHFDIAESWFGIGGTGSFSLLAVAAHEIGHAIGLGHSTDSNALMYPYYNASITSPQADDIAGAVYLYGPSQQVPQPSTMVALLSMAMVGLVIDLRRWKKKGFLWHRAHSLFPKNGQ